MCFFDFRLQSSFLGDGWDEMNMGQIRPRVPTHKPVIPDQPEDPPGMVSGQPSCLLRFIFQGR